MRIKKGAVVVAALLIMLAVAFYWFFKPVASIVGSKPDIVIGATELWQSFDKDEQSANTNFTGKIIKTTGVVAGMEMTDENILTVMLQPDSSAGFVTCVFGRGSAAYKDRIAIGKVVVIKGLCAGFLFPDVQLHQCSIVSKQ